MKKNDILYFNTNYDKYGKLVPIESNDTVPFDIKRIYYIYDVEDGRRRGFHSHKNLEQVLICVHGSVKILLKTPESEKTVVLDDPSKGLYIEPGIWREMYDFKDGAVLLVLASDHYKAEDYIRDYSQYEKEYNKKK